MHEKIVLVPLGILDPTPCASHTKCFFRARSQIFVLVTLMRCQYSSKFPDNFPMTALVTCYCCFFHAEFVDTVSIGAAMVVASIRSQSM